MGGEARAAGGWTLVCLSVIALQSCDSQELLRHDFGERDWDFAVLQTLNRSGAPVGSLRPFEGGSAAVTIETADEATEEGFVVLGFRADQLPHRPGSRVLLNSSEEIRFEDEDFDHPGSTERPDLYGFDRTKARMMLRPLEGSPYLERLGPFTLDAESTLAAPFEQSHVLTLPHEFGCPSSARLEELTDTPFEFTGDGVYQMIPVNREVILLRSNDARLYRVRRGVPVLESDNYAPWVSTATLAAVPDQIIVSSVDEVAGTVHLYLAMRDAETMRSSKGRLLSVQMPLEGDLAQATVEELTQHLPFHPDLGFVPRLRGVAVASDGTVVVVGGDSVGNGPRYGYVALRAPGSTSFVQLRVPDWTASARPDVIAAVPGVEPVFAIGATNGQIVFMRREVEGWTEVHSRFRKDASGEVLGETVEWRRLRVFPRDGGFELWAVARPGLLVHRSASGRWSIPGDTIRDLQLTDAQTGGCEIFGWLSGTDFQTFELVDDELWIGARDCDSLLRVQFDEEREPACVSAITPEGAGDVAKAVDPGLFGVAHWGDEVVVGEAARPLRLMRVTERP